MIEKSFVENPNEMARFYQTCDFYIHTSKADNAPLVILEAMACGKPVVSTRVGGYLSLSVKAKQAILSLLGTAKT